jgi:hypothetical protein
VMISVPSMSNSAAIRLVISVVLSPSVAMA